MDENTKIEEKAVQAETTQETIQPESKETNTEAKLQTESKEAKEKPKRAPKVKVATDPAGKASKKKAKRKGKKVVVVRGKRKESIARAIVREGKGNIRFNSASVNSISNHYVRDLITEPVRYMGADVIATIDIYVTALGGGVMGQAQAARTAIAKGIVAYTEDENLKQKLLSIDRSMLVEDSRRVESKKYKGPKARARFQKSYR